MTASSQAPFFSIILSTRDRPELFQIALQSVLGQGFEDKEVIVVIDGSNESNMEKYDELIEQYRDISFYKLEHRAIGHGQSYAINHGVDKSSGQYLCFLDDDDHWTDTEHLQRAHTCLVASGNPVDVYYSNQRAVYSDGKERTGPAWIDDLIDRVDPASEHVENSYFVSRTFLLSSGGFAHLNCSIFNRDFFLSLGGMDEAIRYENDRDIYIRSIDSATTILFSTCFTSLHNIPDENKKSNMSTVSSMIEKKLYQMRVFDKGISLGRSQEVVAFCCRAKMYEFKHAAQILAGSKQYRSAAYYARAALLEGFNIRWLAYTVYLTVLSWTRKNQTQDNPS